MRNALSRIGTAVRNAAGRVRNALSRRSTSASGGRTSGS